MNTNLFETTPKTRYALTKPKVFGSEQDQGRIGCQEDYETWAKQTRKESRRKKGKHKNEKK